MVTSQNIFAGGRIDRAAPRRADPAAVAGWLADAGTRLIPVWRGRILLTDQDGDLRLAAVPPRTNWPDGGPVQWPPSTERTVVFLGLLDDVPHFAVDVSDLEQPVAEAVCAPFGRFDDLRMAGGALPVDDANLAAYARGLMEWHGHSRYCGHCGSRTMPTDGGHIRRCVLETCAAPHFPRTDPAVIMLVHDGESCLLGRSARFHTKIYSTLAGFVEPGESLEDAVAREVLEETGVRVDTVTYHSSQPWPFPRSVMIGFHARAEHQPISCNDDELEHALWCTRRELRARVAADSLRLPHRYSIAYRLIAEWLAAE